MENRSSTEASSIADFTRRLVDDAAEADVVPGVGHDGHIGVDVLDLLAVVEALAAHDLVGDAGAGEIAFDGGRLGVHPVEDGVVGQMAARLEVLADDVGDVHGLILLVFGGVDLHLVALAVFGPEGLALPLGVVYICVSKKQWLNPVDSPGFLHLAS